MQTIKVFLDQSLNIWKESTSAARFGIVLLLLLCLGGISGVGIWSLQPDYVMLASDLDHQKSTQLMAALDQANIGYQIKGAGSIILVDKKHFNRAAVLAGNRGITQQDAKIEAASPWMDPLNQQNIFRRNLERQLSHSIQKYSNIESAIVHLSIPERQPFLRHTVSPTASVVLGIAPNQRFTEAHATAISQLIANAVPGLRPDQVAITDTLGNVYSLDENMGRLTKQEEYRINRERELALKAQAMLINFLGVGNSKVEVTADFSFPEGKTIVKEFDPEKRVITSETIDSSSSTGESVVPTGAAGTASNVGNNRNVLNGGNRNQNTKSEVVNSIYEVSSTLREDIVRTPIMNLLTVSVLINSNKVSNEGGEIPQAVKASIEAMVKQAVGYRDGVDQFNLEFFEFVELLPEQIPVAPWVTWDQVLDVLKTLSLGVAAIIALFFGFKTIKTLQPTPVSDARVLAADRDSQLSQLSDLVKRNPEVFSKILASWASDSTLGDEAVSQSPVSQKSKAA